MTPKTEAMEKDPMFELVDWELVGPRRDWAKPREVFLGKQAETWGVRFIRAGVTIKVTVNIGK